MKKQALAVILAAVFMFAIVGCSNEKATITHSKTEFQTTVDGFIETFNNNRNGLEPLVKPEPENNVYTMPISDQVAVILAADGSNGNVTQMMVEMKRTGTDIDGMASAQFVQYSTVIINLVTVPSYQLDAVEKLQLSTDNNSVTYRYDGLNYRKSSEDTQRTLTIKPE